MEICLNLLLIQLIIVFIIDISGFVDDGIQPFFRKHFHGTLKTKPFLCSLCLTTWIGLFYILIQGCFTIPMIAYVFLLAYLTPISYNLLITIKEALIKITTINFKR